MYIYLGKEKRLKNVGPEILRLFVYPLPLI
jgi:hypothetical protein